MKQNALAFLLPTNGAGRRVLALLAAILALAAAPVSAATTYTWINTAGGNWSVAANWSPAAVPGPADTANITTSGTYIVTNNTSTTISGLVLGGASGTQTLTNTGAITLTLNGPGIVNLNGVLALFGVTLGGTGSLVANGPLILNGPGIELAGGVTANDTLAMSGPIDIGAGGLGAFLVNNGTATLNSTIALYSSGVFSNSASGTLTLNPPGTIIIQKINAVAGNLFANSGQINVNLPGASTVTLQTTFNNYGSGSVNVNSGTLILTGGGTDSSTSATDFDIAFGAALDLSIGTYTFDVGSTITGQGDFTVSGATANLNGTLSLSGTYTVSSGTANFAGSYDITSPLSITGSSRAIFTGGGNTLAPSTLTLSGTLGGSVPVSVSTLMTFSGTFIDTGGVSVNGTLTMSGQPAIGSASAAAVTLVNNGTATFNSGSSILLYDGASLVNSASGTFTWTPAANNNNLASIQFGSGNFIANMGTFNANIASGNTGNVPVTFNNTGTVNISNGTLDLTSSHSLTGGTLNFGINSLASFGKITLSSASVLAGTLSSTFNGGYLPAVGDSYQVMSYGSLSGNFTATNLSPLAVWQVIPNTTSLTINVLKLVPQISWPAPADIIYGTALSSAQLDATAKWNSSAVPGTFTYTPPVGKVLDSGNNQTLSVTFTPADPSTYTNVTTTVTINVQKAPLTITANDESKTYGQTSAFAGTEFTSSGSVNGDTVTSATLSSTGAAPTAGVAGSPNPIVISAAVGSPDPGLTNYSISYVNGSLTVNQAPLTISANNVNKVYGQTLSFSGTEFVAAGLQNGETVGTVTLLSAGAGSLATAGLYPIIPSALTGGSFDPNNYSVSYVDGTLNVQPAPLTVTANSQAKIYAQTVTFAGTEFTTSGLVNADAVTSVTLTSAGAAATATVVGSPYHIAPSAALGTGLGNYTITFSDGTLTVTAAPLTITVDNQSKVYGAALPALTASYNGFVNGDTVASLTAPPNLSTTATASSAVGTYTVTATGAVDANYSISYVAGTLMVTPASLTITADSKTKVYGAALPTLTASYNGFVNGDTAANLTAPPSLSTTATASSAVGTYSTTAAGAADANYSISYVPGTLTVTAAPLTVTANDASRSYGTANPAFTGTIAGIQNGDNITATYNTTAITTSPVGTYPIVPALVDPGLKLSNYNVTVNNGTLTVTTPGTPTANSQSVTVSENTAAPITLTGNDPNSLALTYTVTTGPTHGSLSGTAPSLTYTPNSGHFGPDSFQFKVNNGAVDSPLATVTITVVGTPTANSQSVTTPQNTVATITLTGTDPNSPPLSLTYNVSVSPSHGALTGTAPNLTYTPNNNYAGSDSFHFTVNNGVLSSAAATVSITVCSPTIYVDEATGNDSNDGATLATAKQTIQAGIDAACDGGTVFVKAGAYAPGAELTVNEDLKIIGDGASLVTVSGGGNGNASVFGINTAQANPGPTVLISGLTIENASAGASGQFGGAVSNSPFASLTLANCTLTNNQAVGAGGVFNDNNATLVVSNSILSGNLAGPAAGGGGIYNLGVLSVFNSTISSNQAPNGGGIYNSGTLIVANSTISSNLVTVNGGGGIDNGGTLTVANSTISGNQASYGGGINLANAATWTAANVTITGNGATGAAGSGGGIDAAVTGTLNNSIVAGNSDSGGADDLGGTIGTASHDLIGDAGSAGGIGNGVNGNIVGNSGSGTINLTTVLDTTLANNGGPTLTHALVVNSPAIDAGDNALIPQDYADQNANGNTTEASPDDQRGPGFPRIFSSIVDMGALEFQGAAPLVTQQPQAATVCDGAAATFTATASGTPTPTVQWQVSTDGGLTWNDVTGATSGTLSFTAAVSQSGNQYRAVFTNTSGPVDSLPAALTVNALPSTPAITADASVCADSTGNTASGPAGAATYSWTISNGALTGLLDQQSVTYTAGASGLVTLTLVVGNSSGCTAQNSVDVPINLPPTTATVGGPQTICPGSTSAALGGNTPIVGMGTWTIVRGGVGAFSSANDPNAAFTHTAGTGPIVLRWTISNPPCPDSSAEVTITLNEPPVAGADTLGTVQNTAVNAPVVKLLANDSSSIHGPLSILSVSSSSAHGGAVALTSGGTMVSYTPAHDFAGLDTFTYTLSDGHCTAQGTVAVTVTSTSGPTLNLISITANSGANFLQFAGIPTFQYVIQSASSSSGPWTDLSGTLTADATGLIIYNDSNPTSPRFYRTRVGP